MTLRLPAEWEEQDGVLLAWPHKFSDWAPILDQVLPIFTEIALRISHFEKVLIVAPETATVAQDLKSAGADLEKVTLVSLPTNDTWCRDFGPITIFKNNRPVLLDFGFNGWGLKFASNFDNQVTRHLSKKAIFGGLPCRTLGFVLEGGSIESDGRGTLLTTSDCLLNPNRNPHLSQPQIEAELVKYLGVEQILWLSNGYLAGDDTDSHIDTLARLAPQDTILYVHCDDEQDEHYPALQRMERELAQMRTRERHPFRLIPLPWPQARFDGEGQRLPATYANYLVINGAVLVPTYNDPRDSEAMARIGEAFPGRAIIGIDCSPLILQHGSLHCVTMQLPKGVLP